MAAVSAWIGLGSNLDDPVAQVRRALDAIGAHPAMDLNAVSSLYRSPPMGPQDQPEYINAVARVSTSLAPLELLAALQAQEDAQRRRRGRRWGARTLDLDVLLYADRRIRDATLTVPHPGIQERSFVLYPLAELAPDLEIPGAGRVDDLIAACPASGLRRLRDDGTGVAVVDEQ